MFLEYRIADKIFDALHRVTHPKLDILMQRLPILVHLISLDTNLLATPGRSMWQLVDLLYE
jgi:hypothetical protein